MRVFLAVDASTPDLSQDDRVLAAALRTRGHEPVALRWGSTVGRGDLVLVRSTWDYVEHPERFAAWLDTLDEVGAVVVNPTPILRWNAHKAYLLDLSQAGVPIVPTELVARGSARTLGEIRSRRAWDRVVVKPAVGGTADGLLRSGRGAAGFGPLRAPPRHRGRPRPARGRRGGHAWRGVGGGDRRRTEGGLPQAARAR